jgi:hypothetical protein
LPEKITSVRLVQLVVLLAERAWAYGLTLKSEFAVGSSTARGLIRHRYIKKFKKAAKYAAELISLAEECCDERTLLEARAYAAWLSALALTESGLYEKALAQIGESIELYTELGRTSLDSLFPSASKAFRHRVTDLEPIERVCRYKMRLGQVAAAPAKDDEEDGFESANDLSEGGEGEVDFSDDESVMMDDEEEIRLGDQSAGLLGKLGGWWSKK